jgi:hypothetical protein
MLKQVPWIRAGSHHHEAFYGGLWYPSAGRNTPNQRGGSRRSSPCHAICSSIVRVTQSLMCMESGYIYVPGFHCRNQSPSANFACRVLLTNAHLCTYGNTAAIIYGPNLENRFASLLAYRHQNTCLIQDYIGVLKTKYYVTRWHDFVTPKLNFLEALSRSNSKQSFYTLQAGKTCLHL